jgi:hypothetical protein
MVGKPYTSTSSSSKRIIKGVPAPILFYGDLVLNLQEYVEDIINKAIVQEEKEAKRSLSSRDESYKKLSKDFKITYDKKNESLLYGVTGKSATEAHALEYGPPGRSLLRHEVAEGSKRMASDINARFDKLTGKDVL